MPSLEAMAPYAEDLVAIRRDLHAHPELGLETPRTASIVAEHLRSWGIEVATGIGGHGVVGTIHGADGGGNGPVIGLRADMDALPIVEQTDLPWKSTVPGRMHACGHDAHTTMLLGAARYLAETRRFRGTAHVIFQPGEEGAGGALAMLDDGLLDRFPCDQLYGLHNWPGLASGTFAIGPGPAMAGGAFFDVIVKGRGAHGGLPQTGIDPVLVAAHVVTAIQGIVARNLSPFDPAVLSITKIVGGDSYNVIPGEVTLAGTARGLTTTVLSELETRLRRTVENVAAAFGASADVDWRLIFAPLVNEAACTTRIAEAAEAIVGVANVRRDEPPKMVSEDFSFMLQRTPGAYIYLGIGAGAALHNPAYVFDESALPYGAALFGRLVEQVLA